MQATSNIEFKYKGKVYRAIPEEDDYPCLDCAFVTPAGGCRANKFPIIHRDVAWQCVSQGIIWQEQSKQKSNKDPEYQKYLELKAKFGE